MLNMLRENIIFICCRLYTMVINLGRLKCTMLNHHCLKLVLTDVETLNKKLKRCNSPSITDQIQVKLMRVLRLSRR
jgi:hypothetical protein